MLPSHNVEHAVAFLLDGLAFAFGYRGRALLLSVASAPLCAGLEIAQLFIPGRHALISVFAVEQEQMWPAVEAALRNISYEKGAFARTRSARDGDRTVYIGIDGQEVQQLKAIALPLIMRLSEDQKREIKSLAHVMDLDGIAGSF
jgi:hypothetical protein